MENKLEIDNISELIDAVKEYIDDEEKIFKKHLIMHLLFIKMI